MAPQIGLFTLSGMKIFTKNLTGTRIEKHFSATARSLLSPVTVKCKLRID
jgi:hypothetical protein